MGQAYASRKKCYRKKCYIGTEATSVDDAVNLTEAYPQSVSRSPAMPLQPEMEHCTRGSCVPTARYRNHRVMRRAYRALALELRRLRAPDRRPGFQARVSEAHAQTRVCSTSGSTRRHHSASILPPSARSRGGGRSRKFFSD